MCVWWGWGEGEGDEGTERRAGCSLYVALALGCLSSIHLSLPPSLPPSVCVLWVTKRVKDGISKPSRYYRYLGDDCLLGTLACANIFC